MMGDAFVRQVLHTDPAPMSFREALTYALHSGKSGRAAARIIGVSESTIRRWKSGTMPKQESQNRVQEAVRGMRIRPTRMGDHGVMLHVVTKERKRGTRERDVTGRQLDLAPGTLDRVIAAWKSTGNADHALGVFLAGVREPWYRNQLRAEFNRQNGTTAVTGGGGAGGGGGGEYDELTGDGYDIEDDYGMGFA